MFLYCVHQHTKYYSSLSTAMHSWQFWSATILLASPAAAAGVVQYCGAVGVATKLPYFTSASSTLKSSAACGKHCVADTKCQSYAIGTNLCLHYAYPVYVNIFDHRCTLRRNLLVPGPASSKHPLRAPGSYMIGSALLSFPCLPQIPPRARTQLLVQTVTHQSTSGAR